MKGNKDDFDSLFNSLLYSQYMRHAHERDGAHAAPKEKAVAVTCFGMQPCTSEPPTSTIVYYMLLHVHYVSLGLLRVRCMYDGGDGGHGMMAWCGMMARRSMAWHCMARHGTT